MAAKTKAKKASKPLDQLAKLICQEHERATEGLHNAVLHAVKCGDYLREAMTQVQHGAWGKWVQDNFLVKYRLADRTERKYRWFSKNQDLLPPKWQQTASFTWQEAEQIIRKKGGKDADDPPKTKADTTTKATEDDTPKPPPLPPRPTAKHLEAAAAVLGEKGIHADAGVLFSTLEELGVDLAPLLKKLELIADQHEKAELTAWLTSHEDRSDEWQAVCGPFGVWSHLMAYAAFRANRDSIFAWGENDQKATRPGQEWCGAIATDFDHWPKTHFFVKADFDASQNAREGAKWLLEHGEAYEIGFDEAAVKLALAAPSATTLADAQPPTDYPPTVEPLPQSEAGPAGSVPPSEEPTPSPKKRRK